MKMHRATIAGVSLGMIATGVLLGVGGCGSDSSNPTPDAGTHSSSGATTTSSSHGSSSGSSSGTSSSASSGTSSSSSGGSDGGSDSGDAGRDSGDAGRDSGDAGADSGDAACTTLNVFNFKAWCSGTINGSTPIVDTPLGTTTTTTVCLPPGAVNLAASAVSSTFELGPDPWISISAIDGGGSAPMSGTLSADGGTSTTTVTLGSAPGCVLLCCPFAMGVHGGLDAGPGVMSGCTSGFAGFSSPVDGGDAAAFTSLCP